jgi:hypothetical protein
MLFDIPPEFVPVLDSISKMADEDVEKIANALASLKPHLKLDNLINQATESGIQSDTLTALFRMTTTRVNAEVSVEQFAEDVTRAMLALPQRSAKFDAAKFQKRVSMLLAVDALTVSARAYDIEREYPNIFDSARVMTDIRPVFTVTGSELLGGMIVHNLKILYYSATGYQELYVSMDNVDLMVLKKVIERAELKNSVLEATLKRSQIQYFESK